MIAVMAVDLIGDDCHLLLPTAPLFICYARLGQNRSERSRALILSEHAFAFVNSSVHVLRTQSPRHKTTLQP
jgi:hypothetical protein